MPKRGTVIAFEGGEGSGKSKTIRRLKRELPAEHFVFTIEPGGTDLGEDIRRILLKREYKFPLGGIVEFLLFEASRVHLILTVILPALREGKYVITDRFNGSSFAYQLVARRGGWRMRLLFWVFDRIIHGICPDWWIWLDVDPVIGCARKGPDSRNRLECERLSFHKRVREGYRRFFRKRTHVYIDAALPFEEMYPQVRDAIRLATGI